MVSSFAIGVKSLVLVIGILTVTMAAQHGARSKKILPTSSH